MLGYGNLPSEIHRQAPHRRRHDGREAGRRDERIHAVSVPLRAARARRVRGRPHHLVVPALGEGAARLLEGVLSRPSLPGRVRRGAGVCEEPRSAADPQPSRGREKPSRAFRARIRLVRPHLRRDPAERRRARLRRGGGCARRAVRRRHQRPVARSHAHGRRHSRAKRCGVLPVRTRRPTRLPTALGGGRHIRRVRRPTGEGSRASLSARYRLRGKRRVRLRRGGPKKRRPDRQTGRRGVGHLRRNARSQLRPGYAHRSRGAD